MGMKHPYTSVCYVNMMESIYVFIYRAGQAYASVFTYAERPSTSSLVGMMPFLLRTAATLSTSPRSTAFISRSSYLFQSVF